MKKILILFFLSLFFLEGIFAVEINMNSEYNQGETLIAKISGDFLTPVGRSNIFFYREHVRVSFEYEITKIGYDYYLYALLVGKAEGNYSLSIEDVKYRTGGITNESDIIRNFSITNQTADFSVEPGFVDVSDDFSLTVKNLKDSSIDVKIKVPSSTRAYIYSVGTEDFTLTLGPGKSEKINFIVAQGEALFQNITLSSENTDYTIPTYIQKTTESPSETQELGLNFQTSTLIIIIPTNSNYKQIIYLYNLNESDFKDVSFSLSDNLSYYAVLDKQTLDIKSKSNASLELSLYSQEEKEVEGYLYANVDSKNISLFVDVEFLENSSEIESPTIKLLTCSEQNATVCNTQTHECSVNLISGKDGWCCPGTCSEKKENNSTGRIIAVVLILGLIGFVTWFYFKKYKKSKKPVDLLKVAKGNSTLRN